MTRCERRRPRPRCGPEAHARRAAPRGARRRAARRVPRGRRPAIGREVAVDGLGADHERPRREPAAAGKPDVQHRGEGPQRERARGRGRRLDRPDPADEAVVAAELALGRGDEEDRGVGGPQGRDPTVRAATSLIGMRHRHVPIDPRGARPRAGRAPGATTTAISAMRFDSVRTEAEAPVSTRRSPTSRTRSTRSATTCPTTSGRRSTRQGDRLVQLEDSSREEFEEARDELEEARDELRPQVEEAAGDARDDLEDALAIERMLERIEDALRDLG